MLWFLPLLIVFVVVAVAVKLLGSPGLLFGVVAFGLSLWWGNKLKRLPTWEIDDKKEPPE
jgi:predicted PurR-regulated permease PerM